MLGPAVPRLGERPGLLGLYRDWATELGCTRVANVSGFAPTGVAVMTAVRPFSTTLTVHQGKGLTDDDAELSALGESIETALASEVFARPASLVKGRDLVSDAWLEVRSDLVGHSCALADRALTGPPVGSASGGLAVHQTRDMAARHGLAELVERPLAAAFLAAGVCRQLIVPELADALLLSATHGALRFEEYARHDAYLLGTGPLITAAWTLETQDLPVPYRFAGFGSRATIGEALLAAALEAVQSYLTFATGLRDDMPWRPRGRHLELIHPVEVAPLACEPPAIDVDLRALAEALASVTRRRVVCVPLADRTFDGLRASAVKCALLPGHGDLT